MAPTKCSYFMCNNTSKDFSIFRFPTGDAIRTETWLSNCGNMTISHLSLQELRNRHLCHVHFDPKFIKCHNGIRKTLNKSAVPYHYRNYQVLDKPHSPCPTTFQAPETSPPLRVMTPTRVYKGKNLNAEDPKEDETPIASCSSAALYTPRKRHLSKTNDSPKYPGEDIKYDFEPAKVICRCCLTTEKRMNNATTLQSYFRELAGLNVTESDGLPQWLCYECSALLKKSVRFKRKVLKAHTMLYDYLARCAPFPIEPQDEELTKYASPHLSTTSVLTIDIVGKGRAGYQVLEHEKQMNASGLDDIDINLLKKIENNDVKEENGGFSDYEDNIILEEISRSVATNITDDDIQSLLQETGHIDIDIKEEPVAKKTKKSKTKEVKVKKKKRDVEETKPAVENQPPTKSSIRKTIELDPTKIKIVTLNPEEQIKQREEESKAGLKFPFQCNLCHKGFNFELKLQNHMKKHSPSRGPYECTICHMYLPTTYSFSVHSVIHNRRYECMACGRRMIDRASILDHYRSQHEGFFTVYTCNICGKVSNNNKTHRGHMRNHHSGDRPKCDQCGKTFINKDSLVEHQQIHQGIKNYECSVCSKRFRTRTQMKHHQLSHSDVKEFYCVECDVRFKSSHNLRQHLIKSMKHRDKQSLKFECSRCPARFACPRALGAHSRVQHDGERAHACAQCGARLASRASLLKHARAVHAGTRPPPKHVCDTCGKAFRGKSVLTNHVRTHTGEKPFECNECGRRFTQRTAMRTHVKLVHLKLRRTAKVKPEVPAPVSPKLDVYKPEPLILPEPWRQPCDVFFSVTAGP